VAKKYVNQKAKHREIKESVNHEIIYEKIRNNDKG
jgi:hypothetical protein